MKGSFKQSLQKEIIKKSSWSALITTGILMILLVSSSYVLQYYQLVRDTEEIVQHTYEGIASNELVLKELDKGIVREFLKGNRTERELYTSFYEKRAQPKLVSDLMVLDKEGNSLFTTSRSRTGLLIPTYYLQILMEQSSVETIAPKVIVSTNHEHYLLFIHPIEEAGERIGYSILFINAHDFISYDDILSAKYILTDKYGNIFAKNSNYFTVSSLEKLDEQLLRQQTIFNSEQPVLTYEAEIGRYLYVYTFQTFFPIHFLAIFSLAITVVALTVYLIQARKIAHKIASYNAIPIESLVHQMKQIIAADKKKVQLETGDEFEFMAEQINQMLEELDSLHEQKLLLEREKLWFERKMLEAQFNPHFLYNTLETIKITHELDPSLTNQLIQNLTSILRYSVAQLDHDTSIGEDLEIIQSYLEIHAVRYESFTYEIVCPESVKHQLIPRLFLLPLIENAMKYGRKYRIDLHIRVQIEQRDSYLYFTVIDNAGGLTKQERQNILESLETNQTQHGVVNSYRRLKEFFDEVQCNLGVNRKGETWIQFVVLEVGDV
ncbi:sensor histidine kinase [Streptococcus sp. zg-86]|uniref:Sensor histidine kinase n=1 Tax=Streptococcus zhangguiae TaxID=2664091 RepID=A0A6I4RIV1_9STRE|nr:MULTISPECIES: histidine kinase [unclassified Streptococcus]MTB64434.1 sensor histidine kinase [Streptococcus sp. zg-86]MTB90876.1 sensor histidine kinase [Streptococcus sp. zg-36]MWV56421.1 sensor histidine kinase [Streptococcus sp. zg-70]QTH47372.1 histidine kinase [Streptococcus sp. zg-86]